MKNTTKAPSSKKFKKSPLSKKEKSPSISRNIPEKKHWYSIFLNKYFMVSFLTILLGVALTLQAISVSKNLTTLKSIEGERSKTQREIIYWEEIVATHPSYRDAYFKLALLEYQLGDREKTSIYLKKTLEIDPNYTPALNFKKESRVDYSL